MRLEVESAALFLSNLIQSNGNSIAGQKLESFRISLVNHLLSHYCDHWFPEKPFKGSGFRCIRINHKMDPVLVTAGRMCGIDEYALKMLFPNELTLWIDPKEVSYRIGENGSICVLFDHNSNDNYSARATPSPPNSLISSDNNSSYNSSPNNSMNSWFNNNYENEVLYNSFKNVITYV